MHVILYTSECLVAEDEVDATLANIIEKAKVNNEKAQITGLLFYHNGRFVQLLEGEKDKLEGLLSKLATDKRHRDIQRIIDEPLGHRYFNNWHMDSFNINKKEQIDPTALTLFKEVYSLNFALKTDKLVEFYKQMLNSQLSF